jgi:hypothetical protein
MATILAVLSVLSAAASIGGLILQYFGTHARYKFATNIMFLSALLFSAYMVLVPGNEAVERVSSKLKYYTREADRDTMIQQSTFTLSGFEPKTIQFPEPYRDPPKVEVLNPNGYCENATPRISQGTVTNHSFEVRRWGSCALSIPEIMQEYKWIAEGRPFVNERSQQR